MTLNEVIEHKPHPYIFSVMNISFTKQSIELDDIEKTVCEYYKISSERLRTKRRHRDIMKARQVYMYLSRKLTQHTLRQIADHIGGYDHTTVVHAVQTVQNLMDTEQDYNQDVNNLLRYFGKKKAA